MPFTLSAPYAPAGDQPRAIKMLVEHVQQAIPKQVLLGVTGSGKTFTIASALAQLEKPTLVVSHNKTLAAQLYRELKGFFPTHSVEYFVSYYDYYQPEVYLPANGTYIEKELLINDELERMRLSTIAALSSNRRDVIVVASVSCIYGLGNPTTVKQHVHHFYLGQLIPRENLLKLLLKMGYQRNDATWKRGNFRIIGDSVDLFVAYANMGYRLIFFGDELEAIHSLTPNGTMDEQCSEITLFPAQLFMAAPGSIPHIIENIQKDLSHQVNYFSTQDQAEEAQRIYERTTLDVEMIKELGYCSGMENYARYIDGRSSGERPFCLLDYFPKDYLLVIDESHVTLPQFKAMWGGDRARKNNLVQYGFRLPAALDNRPLHFNEFEQLMGQTIFVSATPAAYELEASEGVIVEQIIRPTSLLDPEIFVRGTHNQIEDILSEIRQAIEHGQKILITTLTKRMAEELADYLEHSCIRSRYMHSQVKTLDRVAILEDLRQDQFDVLVGVNLLREGIDLPQTALMVILDADKEGFLRNTRSLIQTIGRVARHPQGRVIMYANKITPSMQQAMEETQRRRALQMDHNKKNNITPEALHQSIQTPSTPNQATKLSTQSTEQLAKELNALEQKMLQAAQELRFVEADQLKEQLTALQASNNKKK